jgi:hypothetical protein
MIVNINQEKTKLEENLLNLRKKLEIENKNPKLADTDLFRIIDKKDRNILELKAKFELKEKYKN